MNEELIENVVVEGTEEVVEQVVNELSNVDVTELQPSNSGDYLKMAGVAGVALVAGVGLWEGGKWCYRKVKNSKLFNKNKKPSDNVENEENLSFDNEG